MKYLHNILEEKQLQILKKFASRDRFCKVDEQEFNEMLDYFSDYEMYHNVVPILTDNNSNYVCLYIDGILGGMVCYLSHDEVNLAPIFTGVAELVHYIESNTDAYDFNELDCDEINFIALNGTIENRHEMMTHLQSQFETIEDNLENESIRQQCAFAIMALSKNSDSDYIGKLTNDTDIYISERATTLMQSYTTDYSQDDRNEIALIEKKYGFTLPHDFKFLEHDEIFTPLKADEIIELISCDDFMEDMINVSSALQDNDVSNNFDIPIVPFAIQYFDMEDAHAYFYVIKNKSIIVNDECEIVANNFQDFIFLEVLKFMCSKITDISAEEYRNTLHTLMKRYSHCLTDQQNAKLIEVSSREIIKYPNIEGMPKAIWTEGLLTITEFKKIQQYSLK